MVEISIVCLIYKSEQLAEALYESVLKYTPKLATGQAEFFFIANDPTEGVVNFLKSKNVPHYINVNEHLKENELFDKGFGAPEYMRRVYQGYNLGILKARGQKVVLINSDNFFSRDWLENLLKYSDYKKVVCSTLVEPGQEQAGVFPFAIEKDFGRTLEDFKEAEFQAFAEKNSKTGYTTGGAYMPCLLYKDIAIMAGLYPEGNLAGTSFDEISRFGDEYFYDRLKEFGVEHITAKDSMVYHLKEGEISEATKDLAPYKAAQTKSIRLNERLVVHPTNLIPYITPEVKHQGIIDELGKKVTTLIVEPDSAEEIESFLETIKNFEFKNLETILISNDKKLIKQYEKQLRAVHARGKMDKALYDVFHIMFGEHLLVMNKECEYGRNLLNDATDRNALYYFGGESSVENLITDYMGNFLFPKKLLVAHTATFLGFLVEKGKIEVDFSDFAIVDVSKVESPEVAVVPESPGEHPSIPVMVVRKLRSDGVKGVARAVKSRVRR